MLGSVSENKIAVSVIIPTYKGSKVISNALDSLVRQTINQDSIEVLVIDDCSPDNTLAVVEKYQKKLKHLRIYSTSKNTGNPIAGRNIGIKKARGEYIHFLDHDDKIGDEALKLLYSSAIEWGSDIIYGKYAFGDNLIGGQKIFSNGDIQKASPFIDLNILEILSPHKMFRRLFIEENNLTFDPEVVISEDMYFVMKAFINASVISVKSGYDYYYRVKRHDGGNLTHTQTLESPYVVYYASQRIIKVIQASNLSQREKAQWMKLYTERFLREHFKEILDSATDTTKLDVIYDYVISLVGDTVLEAISSEYKVLVRIVYLRNSSNRQLFLKELNTTDNTTLFLINQKLYFKGFDSELYDVSFLYNKLEYKISQISIKDNLLVVIMPITLILNRRENLKCRIQLINTQNKRSLSADGYKIKPGEYQFKIDIKNALWVAEDKEAVYKMEIILECGETIVNRTIERGDIMNYTEKPLAPFDEKYKVQFKTRGSGDIDITFNSNKYFMIRNFKYRFGRILKKVTLRMLY